ncbi:MAG: ATP-binding protein [Candidatus Omnitrophica bacterium]|nr:ATP-binding protein [Candidatus Omnitrophota bacterium]
MHIDRDLFKIVEDQIKKKEVVILLGPKQVGKSYILKWLKKRIEKDKIQTSFFDLENPETLIRFNQPDTEVYKLLSKSGRIIFVDEFHYLKNASKIFKAIYDSKHRIKIFASGSSSIEIHKHLKESLAGRRFLIKVPPLSLHELETKIGKKSHEYYLRFGGLPGVINKKSQQERMYHLSELVQTYLIKDIKGLIKEENIRAFNMLLYLLAQSQGSLVNVDSLSREIGLTSRSVQRYIDIMQHTFVLGVLSSYSRNLGNELKKSKKYYLYDIGMRNALIKDFRQFSKREDKGCLLESAVYLNLVSNLMPNEDIKFWRTRNGREVDFVLIRDRQPIPIEIKSNIKKMLVPKGLESFLRKYPNTTKAFVFNNIIEGEVKFQKTKIRFIHWSKCSPKIIR